MVLDTDDDLPWDPLWAYVLGDEEESNKGFRRKKKESKEDGLISYIKDVMPTSEGRDDDRNSRRTDGKVARDETRKKGFIWKRNNTADEAQHADSWEWHISTGSSYDDFVASPPQTRDAPSAKERWSKLARHKEINNQSKEASGKDSWDWKLTNGANTKREKRGLGRRFSKNRETDKWDFISTSSQEKGTRRVLFAKASSKNDESWIDTKEVMATLATSQNNFFDWVGINPSYDEDEAKASQKQKQGPISALSRERKQKANDSSTLSDSGFLFGDIFSSLVDENEDSSFEESSFQSTTTGESSAGTIEEEGLSDDDSRSVPTVQSDASLSQTQQQARNSLSPHLHKREVNEVRLSFQPISHDEINSNHLSIIEEEHSDNDVKNCGSELTITKQNNPKNSDVSCPTGNKIEQENELKSTSYDPSRATGRRTCCSVKNLPYEQLKWSEESGIPFHELSREEQNNFLNSGAPVDPLVPVKSWTSETDPLSLFKYDYNSSVQMYVSYDHFGSETLNVSTAPTPRKAKRDSICVNVEVSYPLILNPIFVSYN